MSTPAENSRRFSSANAPEGFTLVELLVVVGILAILMGILIPALGKARAQGQAVVCMSNFRQIGHAIALYEQLYQGYIPSEGLAGGNAPSKTIGPWDDTSFWANSIPVMLKRDSPTYYDLQTAYLNGNRDALPGSGANSVFVCPAAGPAAAGASAIEVTSGYFNIYGLAAGATSLSMYQARPAYWCYVFNSGLDNLVTAGVLDRWGTRHLKATQLKPYSQVVVMVEKMMDASEAYLPAGSPPWKTALNVGKTKGNTPTSCQVSGRHNKGGHLLFLDGHVSWISRADATTDFSHDGLYNLIGSWVWQPTTN